MDYSKLIVMQSHLSDALIEIGFAPEQAIKRIKFVKRLLNEDGERFTEEELNKLFLETNPPE